ncbi:MAG: extracellular solute-binding protein, partial [Rhodospirillales bacterium]|nr:extracellular solute-binding protein [Rhodospirillales bacterium]
LARAMGGGLDNIEPGFKALEQLAKHMTIFEQATELAQLFRDGNVWILPYDSSNAFRLANSGLPIKFVIPKEGSPAVLVTAVIAKDSKNADSARAAINAALSPKAQAAIAEALRWYPVNPETRLSTDLAKEVLVGEALTQRLVDLDEEVIAKNRGDWIDRFNRIVVAK